jgi:DNA-binding NarL/FixJ family response regulator
MTIESITAAKPIILIVEDHDAVRRSLRDWLGVAFPQYQIVEAASGEEAIVMAQASLPRLVIMDIGLAEMNGIEATRRIKAIMPAAQVIMLTIHEDEAYRTDAAVVGVSAYILKRKMYTELIPVMVELLCRQFV